MTDPLPLRSIALCPQLDQMDLIQRVRRHHDRLAFLVPVHATLVFPFASPLDQDALAAHMRWAMAGQGVITITLGAPRIVDDTVQVPLLEGADPIRNLHDRLYTGPLAHHLRRDLPYTPHLTIGRDLDAERGQACLREAQVIEGSRGLATFLGCEGIGEDESSILEITIPFETTS